MNLKNLKPTRIRVAMILTLAVLLLMVTITLAQSGGDFSLSSWTINNGGGESNGGSFSVSAVLGRPDAGALMDGGQFRLQGGFGPPENQGPTQPPAGDGVYLPMIVTQ